MKWYINYSRFQAGSSASNQTVEDEWIQAGSSAYNLTVLCWKLKSIKGALKTINKDNFSDIQKRVSDSNSLLQSV